MFWQTVPDCSGTMRADRYPLSIKIKEISGMPDSNEEDGVVPLPCRGCTVECPDRARCGGLPWRIAREQEPGDRESDGATQR